MVTTNQAPQRLQIAVYTKAFRRDKAAAARRIQASATTEPTRCGSREETGGIIDRLMGW
jgi:hypothetical protein